MKTKFTSVAVFILFIVSSVVHANHKSVKPGEEYILKAKEISLASGIYLNHFKFPKFAAGTYSVPGYSENYSWNTNLNDWQHISNTTYTYDQVGRIIEEIEKEAQTDIYLSRNSYAYDYFGNVTKDVAYIMGIEGWMPVKGQKSEYLYNMNGEITGVIEQIVESGVWVNKTKTEYTLDSFSVPVSMQTFNWNGTGWELYSKTIDVTWENWHKRQISGYILQHLHDGEWVNSEIYISWYNGTNYSSLRGTWDEPYWNYYKREVYSRTANEEILTIGSWNGAGWIKDKRYTTTFDEQGNQTKTEYCTWTDNVYIPELVLYYDLTYNESIDVTEIVLRSSDFNNPEPINISKYVFSNFLHFGTTDIKDVNVLKNVAVFPNPVTDALNIRINDTDVSKFSVSIINLAGRTIFTKDFSSSTITVNTAGFTEGIYLLHIISSDGKIYNLKILKK